MKYEVVRIERQATLMNSQEQMTVYIHKPQREEEVTNSKDNRIKVSTTKESNVESKKTSE